PSTNSSRQTDQPGRRRGAPGRAEEPHRTQQEPLPVAQEPAQPVRPPAHPAGKPLRLEPQDRSGIPYAPSTWLRKLAYVNRSGLQGYDASGLRGTITSPRLRGEVGNRAQARVPGEGDLRAP